MRSTLCAVLLAISLLMPGDVDARDSQDNYIRFATTCGKWLSTPRGSISKSNWIDGYRTAVNLLIKGKKNFYEGVDAESVELYVDKFCRENPLKGFADAMNLMLYELKVPVPQ